MGRNERYSGAFGDSDCHCATSFGPDRRHDILASDVTIVLGFVDGEEGVLIGADGLRISESGYVEQTNAVKTARLNAECCIGFSGDVELGNRIFSELIGQPDDPLWHNCFVGGCYLWELKELTLNKDLRLIRDEIEIAAHKQVLSLRDTETSADSPDVCVMLVGVDDDVPFVEYLGKTTEYCFRRPAKHWMSIGAVDPGLPEFGLFDRVMSGPPMSRSMEERTVAGVRFWAHLQPSRVNGNVAIRRQSHDFRLEWHNEPTPDPSVSLSRGDASI